MSIFKKVSKPKDIKYNGEEARLEHIIGEDDLIDWINRRIENKEQRSRLLNFTRGLDKDKQEALKNELENLSPQELYSYLENKSYEDLAKEEGFLKQIHTNEERRKALNYLETILKEYNKYESINYMELLSMYSNEDLDKIYNAIEMYSKKIETRNKLYILMNLKEVLKSTKLSETKIIEILKSLENATYEEVDTQVKRYKKIGNYLNSDGTLKIG